MSVLNATQPSALTRISTLAVPRVSTSLAAASMSLVSLAPGLLPRSAVLQGVFSGLLVAVGLLVMWALSAIARKVTPERAKARFDERAWRLGAFGVAAAAIAIATFAAAGWQNSLRATMSAPSIGILYWTEAGCVAALTVLILGLMVAAMRKVLHRLGFARAVTTTALCVVGLHLAFGSINPAATVHTAASQSPVSERQKFLASGTASVRVYADLDSAPDASSRATLAVGELDRVGGFARSSVVVAIPTGSGWIDTHAVDGIEQRFGGNVSIVGQQYSAAPSWAAFLFQRSDAEESARALFTAVGAHIAAMPVTERPDLYLYGQSLGAVGGSAALSVENPVLPCDALWAGPPAGATVSDGVTVLANTSDPVVWWSPDLATQRPDLSRAVQDAPTPPWIPVVSFLQTSIDMLVSLDVPAGHGHRYGTQQGTELASCS
ncbi:alpha/beta-hydrolase family protein [Rhodococcus sp. IEGM 1379]|uniref:alpha/beta-hydrolase family protein n=1 Tax=Rhodococcus sp. IEGM 1379 TaxID=3047086 RepID=UPI0024B6A87E|nr:alpha/beta-hydrolase family protein [Rhodococcus sp. IEGM 1379]MDI9917769.1 alpha/beta-hydrolase family protein [Rhodococcus sp. IEGM 1379]